MNQNPLQVPGDESNPFSRPEVISKSAVANPYAPTSFVSETDGLESDVDAFRNRYLSHEASIKSIGILYMISGVMLLILFLVMVGEAFSVAGVQGQNGAPLQFSGRGFGAIFVAFVIYAASGALFCYAGWGIRKFKKVPKIIVTVLSAIGLIGFPFGTVINGYVLYLLHGQKGKVVFSDRYQEVIRQTPHIKYKTSMIVKIFVGLLIGVIVLGIIAVSG